MSQDQTLLRVHLLPNAQRNEITGFEGETLRIRVTAQPVKGKANKALISFLSKSLGIRKSDVIIEKGETSRQKVVRVNGLTPVEIQERIKAL